MSPVPRKRKGKKTKKAKGDHAEPFKYGRNRIDPYHAQLALIREQAHNNQVNELLKQVQAAQDLAKNTKERTEREIYEHVQPMDIDPPRARGPPEAPPLPSERRMTYAPRFTPALHTPFLEQRLAIAEERNERARRSRGDEPTGMLGVAHAPRQREEPSTPRGDILSDAFWEVNPVNAPLSASRSSSVSTRDLDSLVNIVVQAPPVVADAILADAGVTRQSVMRQRNAVPYARYPPIPTQTAAQMRAAQMSNRRFETNNLLDSLTEEVIPQANTEIGFRRAASTLEEDIGRNVSSRYNQGEYNSVPRQYGTEQEDTTRLHACALYVQRCPGITAQKYIARLPTSAQFTPGSHCQLQLPSIHGFDTRSAQLLCDVSTAASSGGPYVLPKYGAQMLVESSTLICGGQQIGGQSNQFLNVYNHIANEYSAGSSDQSKMATYGGAGDVPGIGSAAASWDANGTYTPAQVSGYNSYAWAGASQTNPLAQGSNILASDSTSGKLYYQNGLPQVIEVFNSALETIEPSILPTFLMQSLYLDIGWGSPNILVGPTGGTPQYTIGNVSLQANIYLMGAEYDEFLRNYVDSGRLISCPFKSITAFPGALQQSMDTVMNFTIGTSSLDKLMCCFLDAGYRTPGPVVAGTNTSKYLTLKGGSAVQGMYWTINGQQNPSFVVGPKHAWGQTMTDLGLAQAGKGISKNCNNFGYYLTKLFVWAYSLQMPFPETPNREVSGLSTVSQNAQLSLVVQTNAAQVAAGLETYQVYPLIFAISTQVLNIGAGGQISVTV